MRPAIDLHNYNKTQLGKYYIPIGDVMKLIIETHPCRGEKLISYYRRILGTHECHTDPRTVATAVLQIWGMHTKKEDYEHIFIGEPIRQASRSYITSVPRLKRMKKELVIGCIKNNAPEPGELLKTYYSRITNNRRLSKNNLDWIIHTIESTYNVEVQYGNIYLKQDRYSGPLGESLLDIVNNMLHDNDIMMR